MIKALYEHQEDLRVLYKISVITTAHCDTVLYEGWLQRKMGSMAYSNQLVRIITSGSLVCILNTYSYSCLSLQKMFPQLNTACSLWNYNKQIMGAARKMFIKEFFFPKARLNI